METKMKVDGAEGIPGVRELEVKYPGNPSEVTVKEQSKKIIKSEPVTPKNDIGNRFKKFFFDTTKEQLKSYAGNEAKKMGRTLKKGLIGAISMALLGEDYSDKFEQKEKEYTSYTAYYRNKNRAIPVETASVRDDMRDIILDNEDDAEHLLSEIADRIRKFDMVSIADVYDMIGWPTVFTQNKYGWTSVREMSIERVPKGYLIVLPRPKLLV